MSDAVSLVLLQSVTVNLKYFFSVKYLFYIILLTFICGYVQENILLYPSSLINLLVSLLYLQKGL